ncbi:hypothetical protein ABK040_008023 [Willaertia magna]
MVIGYSTFLSENAKRRKPCPIRLIADLVNLPGMISLGGGLPNPETFQFSKITVELKKESEEEEAKSFEISGKDLNNSLQYGSSYGLKELVQWLINLQEHTHHLNFTENNFNLAITTGSQDALTKIFDMLLNYGDLLLIEKPTYSGALSTMFSSGANLIEVEVDEDGIVPENLEKSIEESLKKFPHSKLKCLYTIPNGQNPTGCSTSLERKLKVLEIARKYNFLIIEDDPYYFLTFDDKQQIPSYLELDKERVLRLDSFSKVFSGGLRVGFCTGPNALIEQLVLSIQAQTLHSSNISQMLIYKVLEGWGLAGFKKHVNYIQQFYKKKRDDLAECVEKYLKDHVDYYLPKGGMFLWLKLKGISDSLKFIEQKARTEKVLLLPGIYFFAGAEGDDAKGTATAIPYVRASFAMASKEQMEEACKRLLRLLENEKLSSQTI